jgi:hypothetical protein
LNPGYTDSRRRARPKKATAAGAKVCREPFDVPGVGRIAILQEPGGAMGRLDYAGQLALQSNACRAPTFMLDSSP